MNLDLESDDVSDDLFDETNKGFRSKINRAKFVSGVYGVMCIAIAFSLFQVYYINNNEEMLLRFERKFLFLLFGILLYFIGSVMMCVKYWKKTFPFNLILLLFLVEGMALILIYVSIKTNSMIVNMLLLYSMIICAVIAFSARILPAEISKCSALVVTHTYVTLSYTAILMYTAFNNSENYMETVYAFIFIYAIFTYFAIDLQLMIEAETHEMCPYDYILGACALYVDLLLIFVYLLHGCI